MPRPTNLVLALVLVLVPTACGGTAATKATSPTEGAAPVSAEFPKADALRARADALPHDHAEEAADLYLQARAELFREWIAKHAYKALDPGKALAGAIEKGWYQELEPEARAVLWRTQVGRGDALRRMRRFRELLVELPLAYPDGKDCPPDLGPACQRHLDQLAESFPALVRKDKGSFDIAIAASVPAGERGAKTLDGLADRVAELKLTTLAFDMTVDRVDGSGRRRILVREHDGHSLRVPLAATEKAPVEPGDRVLVVADLTRGSDRANLELESGVIVYAKSGARFRYLYGVDLSWLAEGAPAEPAEPAAEPAPDASPAH